MNNEKDIKLDEFSARVLEFDKIKRLVAEFAVSAGGKEKALSARPFNDPAVIEQELTMLEEVIALLQRKEAVPIYGLVDLRGLIEQLRPLDSYVEAQDYWTLAQFCEIVALCKKFLRRRQDEAPNCFIKFNALVSMPGLINLIQSKINAKGELLDSASLQLSELRRQIRLLQEKIHRHLDQLLNSLRVETILQDFYFTIRNGRYVLPVRAQSKNRLPGIIQGASHTGETLFIEPFDVVEETNDLADLQIQEKNEVRKILIAIGDAVRHHLGSIEENFALMAELDYLHARAQFAVKYGLNIPRFALISAADSLALFKVHHPLLFIKEPEKSVAVDICLKPEDKVLVLTGPNAGGKTTALKTVGLTALMFQSAIPVALDSNSRLPIFSALFADIGDEQDVTSGLSTFTAHIRNIRRILTEATANSLVLLDELGTATDPNEGSALAVALLEQLSRKAALTIVTSHLSGLKAWAQRYPAARNAAVKLDEKTNLPTYKIFMDIPGTSEALIIARQEGMPSEIIERAREIIQKDELNLAELIIDLQEKERLFSDKIRDAEKQLQQAKQEREHYDRVLKEFEQKQKGWKKEMLTEKERLLTETKQKIERMIAELPSREALSNARKQISEEKTETEKELKTLEKELKTPLIAPEPGDVVFVPSFQQYGRVLKVNAQDGSAELQIKNIKAHLPLTELEPISEEMKADILKQLEIDKAKIQIHTTSTAEYRLDLHGLTVEEALKQVDEFLDRAIIGGLGFVKIIHGHGSGKLQRQLHEFLRHHPQVQSFRYALPVEGSTSATIVYLKE